MSRNNLFYDPKNLLSYVFKITRIMRQVGTVLKNFRSSRCILKTSLKIILVVAIMLVDDKDDGLAGNTYPFDINVLHEDFQVLPTNDSYVYLVVHDGPRVSPLSLARNRKDLIG